MLHPIGPTHMHNGACERMIATSSLPENGWFGARLCRPTPVLSLKRVFAYVFTDVSRNECEPQHGRQRRIVEQNANLIQIERWLLKAMVHYPKKYLTVLKFCT